jgi:hypothetical protein
MRLKLVLFCILLGLVGCSSTSPIKQDVMPKTWDPKHPDNIKFLEVNSKSQDLFRVLLTSENYIVSQMYALETIERADDKSGDKYYSSEIKDFDIMDEIREGVFSVTIFPDSGKLNKIRPERLTYLNDIDSLIAEDIQRWMFKSPRKRSFDPTKFNVRYRVVLHKSLSDEEILKRIR